MSDSITTTTEESWFSRIGGAIKGVVFGLVLAAIAFIVLFRNEGRAVKTAKALDEGAGAVVTIDAAAVSPATEGKLVHLTGTANAEGALADADFGVTSPGALRLVRKVEMYQWEEKKESKTEKKLGGGATTTTTTSYAKAWSDHAIDSSSFASAADHVNPGSFPVSSMTTRAAAVTVGAHTLNDSQVSSIPASKALTPAAGATPVANLPKVSLSGGYAFIGKDAAAPAVGDLRVSFAAAGETAVSLVAKQKGETFSPYTTSNGRTVDLLKTGNFTSAEMFARAEAANSRLTWILRFVGFVVMGIGFSLVLRPLSVLADVLPFLGDIVGIGTGFIAFTSAAALSLVTIAVARIVYRPVVGIALLLVAGGITYAVIRLRKAGKAAVVTAPAEPAQA